jgi:hypothetical protein
MAKKSRKARKLGRHEVLGRDQLLNRFRAHKLFFEGEWGRIGLALQRVRKPSDLREALRSVPNIEWRSPFRDHTAGCLISEEVVETEHDEVKRTRRELRVAEENLSRLWSEYHSAHKRMSDSIDAMRSFMSYFALAIGLFPFFFVAVALKQELEIERFASEANRADEAVKSMQRKKEEMKALLSRQEAWYAQNEVLKFVHSKRYEKNALNFAKAITGMPEYGWLRSLRKCSAIQDESLLSSSIYYQLFETVQLLVQKKRRVNVRKTLMRLKKELLRDDSDPMLRAFVSPHWAYMELAFAECQGKGFKRSDLPYKIMGRYLDHIERSKTPAESELARRNQLVSEIK